MKKIKRIVALLMCALMIITALPIMSAAADEFMPFTDVKEGAWYYEGIEFCYLFGIVNGMTETTFVPNGTLTRAQFVQMLAMYSGVDLEEYKTKESGFDDVKTNYWFNAPVCWAVEQGYVKGLSETKFGPNDKITREQLARLLYLYAESMGCEVERYADLSAFEDESKVSDWAYSQVQWAVAAGIISGTSETALSPRATATRAQACRMMMTFDDFISYGFRDTSGAFQVIAEYIMANDTLGFDNYFSAVEENDGVSFSMDYDASAEFIYVLYNADPYECKEQGVTYTAYRENATLFAYSLGSSYDYNYYKGSADGKNYMTAYGYMTLDSYIEDWSKVSGYSKDDLTTASAYTMDYIRDRIAAILAEADMTLEDFFLPMEKETDGNYEALAQYVVGNGEEAPFGSIVIYTEDGDKAYVTEYVSETGELCFVYVSEPIPGGTDIYDTEYREHAILLFSSTVNDGYVRYTYVNEDEGKNIMAEGSFNGAAATLGDIEATGFGEEVAAKVDGAVAEVIGYYLEILALATETA